MATPNRDSRGGIGLTLGGAIVIAGIVIAIFWSLVCSLLILPSVLALASPRAAART